MMTWTDERIETLRTMWEAGQTASQIAEALGGVSRNAVIGKAHRLNLQARPSPVRTSGSEAAADVGADAEAVRPEGDGPSLDEASDLPWSIAPEPTAAPVPDAMVVADYADDAAAGEAVDAVDMSAAEQDPSLGAADDEATDAPAQDAGDDDDAPVAVRAPEPAPAPLMRSVGPGGFVRQSPGEQQPPIAPAPPRRLVPAKPSADIAGKTGLLDLSDKICKWPLGHPGEPDFHFCGQKVNPGFPYCIEHCGHAYQAQLPRRDRRPPPPLPFGGPRVR